MKYIRLILIFIILTTLGILYERYKTKFEPDEDLSKYHLVQKYLLNEDVILGGSKPLLWVHTKHEINSRQWESFFSRSSYKLNQKYIELCIESIIRHCNDSFNIVLIDDDSFEKLIPSWNVDMENVPDPIKSHLRSLGILKLMYYYGGMTVPNSSIVLKDLLPLYKEKTSKEGGSKCFVGEMVTRNTLATYTRFYPSHKIMGCEKNCKCFGQIISKIEKLIKEDNTTEMDFNGKIDKYIYEGCQKGKIKLVSGKLLGTKTKEDKVVVIDELLNNTYIPFDENIYMIYLPKDEILKRRKYQWFTKLNRKELFECDTIASKQLVISHEI
jgi:hypothetical protein